MKSSRDDIILILIVGYVCYSTITGGNRQHSAVALFNVYVAASERMGAIWWGTRFRVPPLLQTGGHNMPARLITLHHVKIFILREFYLRNDTKIYLRLNQNAQR